MKITITKNKELKEISIRLGTKNLNQIIASETSDTWNTKGINDFLKKIVELNPEDEKIEVFPLLNEISSKEEKDLYFIIKLFTEFANEYNQTNEEINSAL